MPKIVKDAPIAFLPKPSRPVQKSFDYAQKKARDQNWDRVIIIGCGPGGAHVNRSSKWGRYDEDALGMIELAKKKIMDGDI